MIRVLIAEYMHMIRGALVALLSREDDMDTVAELDLDPVRVLAPQMDDMSPVRREIRNGELSTLVPGR